MKAYPARFLTVFWWVQSLLLASGLLLLPGMLELRLDWVVPEALLFSPRVWLAALHALLAFIALTVFGALLPLHVRHGLRQRHNKRSGWMLLSIYLLLLLTAWGIYYCSNETLSMWASMLHVMTGLLVVVVLAVHVVFAKRIQALAHTRRMAHLPDLQSVPTNQQGIASTM